MNTDRLTIIAVLLVVVLLNVAAKLGRFDKRRWDRLGDHTVVTASNVFPYVVAVLKKQSYLSAGALLDDKWVVTAANALFLNRESTRTFRVRLGSINYKKGGVLLPVKVIEVHPDYTESKPAFDLALIRLAVSVRLTPRLYPIRMLTKEKEVTATHFIVTGWTPSLKTGKRPRHPVHIETIKQRRMLSVSHLHPADPEHCSKELDKLDVTADSVMCLDSDLKADPCWRVTGAPVVLNGILWGIISSWKPVHCRTQPSSNFVTLVGTPEVQSWVHVTVHGHAWNQTLSSAGISTDDLGEDSDVISKETNEI